MPTIVSPLEIARRERGLTQLDLAARAGVARETISRLERGEWPRLRTAHAIAKALGVEIAAVLGIPGDASDKRSPRAAVGDDGTANPVLNRNNKTGAPSTRAPVANMEERDASSSAVPRR